MANLLRTRLARSNPVQALVIASIALALRVGLDAGLAPHPWPDSHFYLMAGRDLLHSGQMASNIRMPLYPLFLAGIGAHYVILMQALLSAATAAIAYYLAREIFRSTLAAGLAGLLAAFDPVAIFYADQRLSETLCSFLLILSLLFFYRRKYLVGSVLFVLTLLARPTFDLLAIPLVLLFSWTNEGSLPVRRAVRRVATYIIVYLVLMSPWWWHNYNKYGTFVRLDLGDGIIFRLEQSPEFAKYGLDWQKLRPITLAMEHPKDPVRRDAELRHSAIEYVRAHPLHYLKLCVRRFGRFWSPIIDQDEHFAPRVVRAAAFVMTAALYVLSLIVLVSARAPLLKKLLPVLVTIAYLATVHTLTHALPRYRVPIEPLLYVLASGAVLRLPFARSLLAGSARGSLKAEPLPRA